MGHPLSLSSLPSLSKLSLAALIIIINLQSLTRSLMARSLSQGLKKALTYVSTQKLTMTINDKKLKYFQCSDCGMMLDEKHTCFVRDGKTFCKKDYIRYLLLYLYVNWTEFMRDPTHCYIYVKMAQQEMMVECKHGSTTKYVLCNCVYHSSSDICTKI